jgi:hypothetical protein
MILKSEPGVCLVAILDGIQDCQRQTDCGLAFPRRIFYSPRILFLNVFFICNLELHKVIAPEGPF